MTESIDFAFSLHLVNPINLKSNSLTRKEKTTAINSGFAFTHLFRWYIKLNMMIHQVAEKLTVTDVRDSSPKKYSAFEGGVQDSGVSEDTSKFNHNNDTSKQELYVQILDEILDQILEHGLSNAESKIFVYFLKLDRFGDRPAKVKVAEVLLATGVSRSAYHLAMAKFERRGWFGFKYGELEVSNFCTPKKKSKKMDSHPEKWTVIQKNGQSSKIMDSQSKIMDTEKPKALPDIVSEAPQTLQTYSNLLHTLSEDQRESFKKFCLKKIQECSFKIGSKEAWLNKYGAEYLEEFKETYSYALANPEVIPPKVLPFDIPDIPYLKRIYGNGWKDAAIHFGLIDPNSPEEEIQDESEPVASSEVTAESITDSGNPQELSPKPIANSDNSQEPTPPTSAISSNHEQFAEGDKVVVVEVGNSHYGKTGKIIAARSRSQDDKYIIALDRKSPSARELTIKIPKGCKLTYLTKL
jgi:hypothetical protein